MDFILTGEGQLPEASHLFWKKSKGEGGALYEQTKHPFPLKRCKVKVLRVLNRKSGGVMDGVRNLVVIYIEME